MSMARWNHPILSQIDTEGDMEVKRRSQISDEFKWRLEDLYATDEDWEKDAARLVELTGELTALAGQLSDSADVLLKALQLQDAVGETGSRLVVYARMRRDEDNTNPKYQALTDKAMGLAVQMESACAFLVPEIL